MEVSTANAPTSYERYLDIITNALVCKKTMKVFLNDRMVDADTIEDILEPGFLFGWGVFETLRVYDGTIVFLKEHLTRLNDGCRKTSLIPPRVDVAQQIKTLLKENALRDAYCRISVFKKRASTGITIYVSPFSYYQAADYQKGSTAIVSSFVRNSKHPLISVKAISYLENRLAWQKAQDKGKDEALFLNEKGYLTEGSRTNIFFIKNKTVYTPSLDCGMLDGITRRKAITVIKRKKIKLKEGAFQLNALLPCDEAFLTSSLMEVMPLVEVNGRPLGTGTPGAMTHLIHQGYQELIQRGRLRK